MDINMYRMIFSCILGIGLTAIFSGILCRRNLYKIIGLFLFISVIEMLVMNYLGGDVALRLYPLFPQLFLMVSLVVIFKLRVYNAVVFTLLAYQCYTIPGYLSRLCYYSFPENHLIELMIYILLVIGTLLIAYFYVGDSITKLIGESVVYDIAIGIIPVTFYIFDYVTTVLTNRLYEDNYYSTQFMPFMVCLAYLYFIIFLQRERKRKREAFEEKSMKERELAIVENEVKNLHNLQEMARIYRHDIRHHFALISDLLLSGNTYEAVKYIYENMEVVENITPMKYCDLDMLNLLLLEYAEKAKRNQIDYKFHIDLPNKLPFSNIELCILISNVWGYAFDEQLELTTEDRYIYMSLGYLGEMFVISSEAGSGRNGKHSDEYGIKSMMAIVNKHNGMAMIQDEGQKLNITLSIPISS